MNKIAEKVFNRMAKTVKAENNLEEEQDKLELELSILDRDLDESRREFMEQIEGLVGRFKSLKNQIPLYPPEQMEKRQEIQKHINDLLTWHGQLDRIIP